MPIRVMKSGTKPNSINLSMPRKTAECKLLYIICRRLASALILEQAYRGCWSM